mgnify:FL=1
MPSRAVSRTSRSMNSNPVISIIVPIYGVEQYIEQCARSLFEQTYPHIELIFVNDGTPDASMSILRGLIDGEYPHMKPKIKIVEQANSGLPAARKTGLASATGDYVLFVDSDDWLELDAAQELAECAAKTDADLVFYNLFKEKKDKTVVRGDRDWTKNGGKMAFIRSLYDGKSYGYLVIKCFKRSIYTDNPVYFPPKGMQEDTYMATQLIYYTKSMCKLDKALYHYRRTNLGSLSRQRRSKKRLDTSINLMDLYLHFKDNLTESPIQDVYGRILYYAAWNAYYYKLPLLEMYPELAQDVLKISIGRKNMMPIYKQIAARIYVRKNGKR